MIFFFEITLNAVASICNRIVDHSPLWLQNAFFVFLVLIALFIFLWYLKLTLYGV